LCSFACYVKGAQDILDKVCEKLGIGPNECTEDCNFSIDACRCIGACGLAPVMMVNDEVYGKLTVDQVDAILDKYID
jgi:NADP-reducing hydrogenase subunit HndA